MSSPVNIAIKAALALIVAFVGSWLAATEL